MTHQTAFFVIADISGYTKFMAETEIDHAKAILEELFGAVIPAIRSPMAVSGLQGDAVFAYAYESDVLTKQFIIDFAEQLYCAFARSKEKIAINSSCTCSACSNVKALELKVIVHHGDCVIQETNGRRELAGKDVITAFRLLKNTVRQRTGLSAYMLISQDALRRMDLEGFFSSDETHAETIEHIGEVRYVVRDLRQVWERRRSAQRIIIGPEDDLLGKEFITAVPVSPAAAFTACTRPDLRARWVGADTITVQGGDRAKVDAGTLYHCHHGKNAIPFEIIDWQPGEYATGRYSLPMGVKMYETNELVSVGEGTLVKVRVTKAKGGGIAGWLMAKMINRSVLGNMARDGDSRAARLKGICQEMLAQDKALGSETAPVPVALNLGDAAPA